MPLLRKDTRGFWGCRSGSSLICASKSMSTRKIKGGRERRAERMVMGDIKHKKTFYRRLRKSVWKSSFVSFCEKYHSSCDCAKANETKSLNCIWYPRNKYRSIRHTDKNLSCQPELIIPRYRALQTCYNILIILKANIARITARVPMDYRA